MEQRPLIDIPPTPKPDLPQLIESLLFVAGEPVAVADLARALDAAPDAVEEGLADLTRRCAERGVRVQRHGERVQLVSAPECAAVVERFLGGQPPARLSAAALEVLAIIAYRQPVTRAQVEQVRGVDSGGVIRALLGRELVAEVGRLETVGRPILYATTAEFLRQFGLASIADLPPLDLFPTSPATSDPARAELSTDSASYPQKHVDNA